MKAEIWDTVANERIAVRENREMALQEAARYGGPDKGYHVFDIPDPVAPAPPEPAQKPEKKMYMGGADGPGLFD